MLSVDDIKGALSALDHALGARGVSGEIGLVGGAALRLAYKARISGRARARTSGLGL